jgi:hypothetical protein
MMMVTKRKPGAVLGRPRKAAVPKLPSGTTGRPAKPTETDPNRYLYVEIQSLISYHEATGTGVSDNRVAETVIAGHYGTPVTTETIIGSDGKPLPPEDNIKAMAEGRPFRVYALPKRGGILNKGEVCFDAIGWRNKNIFRPAADDVLHKLRALRAERNLWLMTMDALVNTCWRGTSEDPAVIERCRQMADSIGERRIFEKKLLPQLRSSAKLRKAGAPGVQMVPGFLSGSFRTKRLEKTGKK